MPTGYTAGILDGGIKDFSEFAKLCTRAFGATIHLRDEPLKAPYTPRKPSKYHKKEIKRLNEELKTLKSLSDADLVTEFVERTNRNIEEYKKIIDSKILNQFLLEGFLSKANSFTPPTPDHEGIKEFMVNQIEETIKFDCSCTYYNQLIEELTKNLESVNATKIRTEQMYSILKDINYHKDHYKEELDRCKKSNEWVEAFCKSLETI